MSLDASIRENLFARARTTGILVSMILTPAGQTLVWFGRRADSSAVTTGGLVSQLLGALGSAVFFFSWAAITRSRAWRWACVFLGVLPSVVFLSLGAWLMSSR